MNTKTISKRCPDSVNAVSYTHLLVQWCYGKAGIALPRTAQEQYNVTQHIPLSEAKAGDLVFFHSTYNAGTYITHVGLYVGNNRMYHAGNPIGYADKECRRCKLQFLFQEKRKPAENLFSGRLFG